MTDQAETPEPADGMRLDLSALTDPEAVRGAAKEQDDLGWEAFRSKHQLPTPGRFYVQVDGRLYPAAAIAGVAFGRQYPQHGNLSHEQFSGGEAGANAALRRLGFDVFSGRPDDVKGELAWRFAVWQHICRVAENGCVKPALLRAFGAYGGGQGIWVDSDRTKSISPGGVAVGVLHTGVHYPDDLSEHGVMYHYPSTKRLPGRDASEVAAMKTAANLRLPIFVISKPAPKSDVRNVNLGWVTGWDEESKVFLVQFGEVAPDKIETEDRSDDEPFQAMGNRSRRAKRDVRTRPDQSKFKLRVLQRYGRRCPLSGVTVLEMLEAVHFIPDSKGGSADPRNGLLMNAALHRAFDAGLFVINPDTLKVETRPGGHTLDDLGIRFPSLTALPRKPHREALAWRYEWWKKKIQN